MLNPWSGVPNPYALKCRWLSVVGSVTLVGNVEKNNSDNILITPKSITVHEKYDDGSHDDIAVIKLEKPLSFNENVGPACLPKKSYDPKAGTECFISGWGSEEQEIPGENDSG